MRGEERTELDREERTEAMSPKHQADKSNTHRTRQIFAEGAQYAKTDDED